MHFEAAKEENVGGPGGELGAEKRVPAQAKAAYAVLAVTMRAAASRNGNSDSQIQRLGFQPQAQGTLAFARAGHSKEELQIQKF